MVAGQILDLEAEEKQIDLAQLEQIHQLKTGELLILQWKWVHIWLVPHRLNAWL